MTYEDSGWLGRDPKFIFLYFLCFFILKPLFLDPLVFLYSRWTTLRTEKRGGHGTATWHPFGTLSKPTPLWSESFVFTMKSENQKSDAAHQDLTLCWYQLLQVVDFLIWFPKMELVGFIFWKTTHTHTVSGKESLQRDLKLGSTDEQIDMGVSKNKGTPKSSILIGFSIIFTIHFGVPKFLETPTLRSLMSPDLPALFPEEFSVCKKKIQPKTEPGARSRFATPEMTKKRPIKLDHFPRGMTFLNIIELPPPGCLRQWLDKTKKQKNVEHIPQTVVKNGNLP